MSLSLPKWLAGVCELLLAEMLIICKRSYTSTSTYYVHVHFDVASKQYSVQKVEKRTTLKQLCLCEADNSRLLL